MYLYINIFNRMYNTAHPNAHIPYKYYYDVFHLEFSSTLGFGLPKTDCCNECTVFIATKKEARKQLDRVLFLQTKALHDIHLKIAHDRRDQMEIDMGAMKFNDPQTTNVTFEHNESEELIEQYGPANIFNITVL